MRIYSLVQIFLVLSLSSFAESKEEKLEKLVSELRKDNELLKQQVENLKLKLELESLKKQSENSSPASDSNDYKKINQNLEKICSLIEIGNETELSWDLKLMFTGSSEDKAMFLKQVQGAREDLRKTVSNIKTDAKMLISELRFMDFPKVQEAEGVVEAWAENRVTYWLSFIDEKEYLAKNGYINKHLYRPTFSKEQLSRMGEISSGASAKLKGLMISE